jgi:hypothetical protein
MSIPQHNRQRKSASEKVSRFVVILLFLSTAQLLIPVLPLRAAKKTRFYQRNGLSRWTSTCINTVVQSSFAYHPATVIPFYAKYIPKSTCGFNGLPIFLERHEWVNKPFFRPCTLCISFRCKVRLPKYSGSVCLGRTGANRTGANVKPVSSV